MAHRLIIILILACAAYEDMRDGLIADCWAILLCFQYQEFNDLILAFIFFLIGYLLMQLNKDRLGMGDLILFSGLLAAVGSFHFMITMIFATIGAAVISAFDRHPIRMGLPVLVAQSLSTMLLYIA